MTSSYPPEVLDPYDDNGTMTESRQALEDAVVGHRIVSVERGGHREGYRGIYGPNEVTLITLDNGKRVRLVGEGDCCAYTNLTAFLLHPDKVDHMIMGVGTTDGYTSWHVFADAGDVLELTVDWSPGNPFYYAYGFHVTVEDATDDAP